MLRQTGAARLRCHWQVQPARAGHARTVCGPEGFHTAEAHTSLAENRPSPHHVHHKRPEPRTDCPLPAPQASGSQKAHIISMPCATGCLLDGKELMLTVLQEVVHKLVPKIAEGSTSLDCCILSSFMF